MGISRAGRWALFPSLSLLLGLLVSLLVLGPGCAAASAASASGTVEQRLAFLNAKSQSGSRVAHVVPADLAALVQAKAPRGYHIVTTISSSGCKQCADLVRATASVATELLSHGVARRVRDPVFFVAIDVGSENQEFISRYKLQFVPVLFYFSSNKAFPTDLHNSPDNLNFKAITGTSNPFTSTTVKQFLNRRLGTSFPIRRIGPIAFKPLAMQLMPILALMAGVVAMLAFYFNLYRQPMFWFMIMCVIYAFGTSGSYYVFLHNSPLLVFGEEGIQFVQNGSRNMYAAEGILAVSAYAVIAGALILAPILPTHVKNQNARSLVFITCMLCTVIPAVLLYSMFARKYPSHLVFSE